MTLAQYKTLMDGLDVNKDVAFIFTAENTKIMPERYPKIELDEANELLKAYIIHPGSKPDTPIYTLSFVCTLDSVFAIQFRIRDGVYTTNEKGEKVFTPSLQEQVEDAYFIGRYS